MSLKFERNKEKLSLITFTIIPSKRSNFKTVAVATNEADIVYRKLKIQEMNL
mgnify:CR=1